MAIVPRYKTAAHTKLLGTPGVHVLATLSPGFRFLPQDAWKGGEDLSTGTKFAVDIVVFYNEAGRRAYGGGLHRGGALARYLQTTFKLDRELSALPELDRAGNFAAAAAGPGPSLRIRAPPRFHLAQPETPLPPLRSTHATPLPWASEPRAGRWDSHEIAYIDGSKSPDSCAEAGRTPHTPDMVARTSPRGFPLPSSRGSNTARGGLVASWASKTRFGRSSWHCVRE